MPEARRLMLLPRLPDPVPPAQHEIAASYIGRLARLHGLSVNALWRYVTEREASGGMRRVVIPERLAAVTGRTVHALAGALPELRTPQPDWAMFRHQPQRGCRHCDAKHPGGEVIRILPHHRYVCTRHRLWLCPSDVDGHTTPLDALPEIVQAQRRHLRILRRHGWVVTYDAVLTAILICGQLWSLPENKNGEARHDWVRRASILIPPDTAESAFSVARLCAVVYPEAVALASLFASPYWRRQAQKTTWNRRLFDAEIAQRLRHPSYSYKDHDNDPISHWANVNAKRPPLAPMYVHDQKRNLRKSALIPATQLAQQRHAQAFDPSRRAGEALVAHRYLATVFRRAWDPRRKHELLPNGDSYYRL
ncbi:MULTISPECIES: TniQ family protein [Streptomyces]|uniref:TniQ family protein n=1 Tax=Streptomyces gibsoniae TaxID=3075529 RepID=A0ABU2U4M1_9ACTN|nr:TniQ family protein [Streptomyces sp. DSM 41699]MDT0468171.1 TniQ family protein [Streptomyces sp. DSM 41699]